MYIFSSLLLTYAALDRERISGWLESTKHLPLDVSVSYALCKLLRINLKLHLEALNNKEEDVDVKEFSSYMVKDLQNAIDYCTNGLYTNDVLPTREYIFNVGSNKVGQVQSNFQSLTE